MTGFNFIDEEWKRGPPLSTQMATVGITGPVRAKDVNGS